jgi:hypothetical protein
MTKVLQRRNLRGLALRAAVTEVQLAADNVPAERTNYRRFAYEDDTINDV